MASDVFTEFDRARIEFVKAAQVLAQAWDKAKHSSGAGDCEYPTYLPSFDEFVNDLQRWRDASRDGSGVWPPQRCASENCWWCENYGEVSINLVPVEHRTPDDASGVDANGRAFSVRCPACTGYPNLFESDNKPGASSSKP